MSVDFLSHCATMKNHLEIFQNNRDKGESTVSLPNIFKALSDPVRREILLKLKQKRKMSAGEIAAEFDLTNATISYHLSTLKKADLIFERVIRNTSIMKSIHRYLKVLLCGLCNFRRIKMNPKNKRTLFLTSTICIILSIVAFALSTWAVPVTKTIFCSM